MLHVLQTATLVAFATLMVVGGVIDALSYRIPNWISLALLAAFGLAALTADAPFSLVAANVGAGAAAFAVGVLFFALRWIGGGDAKLFAAAALWLGWPAAAPYVLGLCLAGGALAFVLLLMRSAWVQPFAMTGPAWLARLAQTGAGVPYGVAVAAGALMALPASPLAKALGAAF